MGWGLENIHRFTTLGGTKEMISLTLLNTPMRRRMELDLQCPPSVTLIDLTHHRFGLTTSLIYDIKNDLVTDHILKANHVYTMKFGTIRPRSAALIECHPTLIELGNLSYNPVVIREQELSIVITARKKIILPDNLDIPLITIVALS